MEDSQQEKLLQREDADRDQNSDDHCIIDGGYYQDHNHHDDSYSHNCLTNRLSDAVGQTRMAAGGGPINMSDYSEMSRSRNLREAVAAADGGGTTMRGTENDYSGQVSGGVFGGQINETTTVGEGSGGNPMTADGGGIFEVQEGRGGANDEENHIGHIVKSSYAQQDGEDCNGVDEQQNEQRVQSTLNGSNITNGTGLIEFAETSKEPRAMTAIDEEAIRLNQHHQNSKYMLVEPTDMYKYQQHNPNLQTMIRDVEFEREHVLYSQVGAFRSSKSIHEPLLTIGSGKDDDFMNRSLIKLSFTGHKQTQRLPPTYSTDRLLQPKFSILKKGPSQFAAFRQRGVSRFDRKGHEILPRSQSEEQLTGRSTGAGSGLLQAKKYVITFADDVKEIEAPLADVVIVESYKEHNYDNTHKPSYPVCPCCVIF